MSEFKIDTKSKQSYSSLGVIESKDNSCPNCDNIHNDNDLGYKENGKQYPKRNNKSEGYNLDGNYFDWDELHCCEDCGLEYCFRNGAY